jgi:hypothetical protein
MAKFRRKPAIIDAIRLKNEVLIDTLNGVVKASAGEWLITGTKGEQYPCADDIFREIYEPADDAAEEIFKEG